MMKYSDLVKEIDKLNISHEYHHWSPGMAPNLPYILHFKSSRNDIPGDNINFHKVQNVIIELYSDKPDFENEEKIEEMLEALGLYYETDEPIYIEESQMYLRRYETKILEGR